jgi:hypothetical protein
MDITIQVPLREILAVSNPVSNYLHDQVRKRRVFVENGNTGSATAEPDEISDETVIALVNAIHGSPEPLYAVPSSKVNCTLNDEVAITATADHGSEVNVMSKSLFDQLDYPLDTEIRWRINAYNEKVKPGAPSGVLGVCHRLPITVGGITTNEHVFVVEHANQDLLLGRPWERHVRATIENKDNGDVMITIRSPDGRQQISFRTVRGDDPRCQHHVRVPEDFDTSKPSLNY